jgi:hypothetical protein
MRQIKKTIFESNLGFGSCKPKSGLKNVVKMELVPESREHEKLVEAKNVFSLAYDGGFVNFVSHLRKMEFDRCDCFNCKEMGPLARKMEKLGFESNWVINSQYFCNHLYNFSKMSYETNREYFSKFAETKLQK